MITYDFDAISATSTDIRTSSARIDAMLGDLKSRIAPMVATWEGDASAAYQNAQARWDRAAGELRDILATVSRVVADGNDRMAHTNAQAAASWA
ncbi:MAG: WXG100 family type VII secretion target [Corynebacterium sp.]|nr:WXG100 family type VII secretion target [Corynebacterium sp.]